MRIRGAATLFPVVFLAGVLLLPGCGSGDKKAEPGDAQVEAERKETQALEARMTTFKSKLDALDTKNNKFNEGLKNELIRFYQGIKVESLRKNALEGTIPPNARERMTKALDEAEKKLAEFPK